MTKDSKEVLAEFANEAYQSGYENGRKYEREQIRQAFWSVFKGAGELFFPDFKDNPEWNESEVQGYWNDILEQEKGV